MPLDLRRRLNSFYNFVFSTKQFMESSPTLTELPPQLRVQLLLAANMRTLAGVPIFKHCTNQVEQAPNPTSSRMPQGCMLHTALVP